MTTDLSQCLCVEGGQGGRDARGSTVILGTGAGSFYFSGDEAVTRCHRSTSFLTLCPCHRSNTALHSPASLSDTEPFRGPGEWPRSKEGE